MERLDHVAELVDARLSRLIDRVSGVRAAEADRAVCPRIANRSPEGFSDRSESSNYGDGQQFHGRDAERFEIRDFLDDAAERAGMANAGGGGASEPSDVQFINDRLVNRLVERLVTFQS